MTTAEQIRRAFARAGATGSLHAVDLDHGGEIAVDADAPAVMASVFKLAVLAELYRAADAGLLELHERLVVHGDGQTLTGIAQLRDPVEMSLRDLAQSMITISDCAAADAVFDHLGEAAINANLTRLGLQATVVSGCCRDMLAAAEDELARTTARDMTRLLAAIWRDAAASPGACAEMRRMLGLQVWSHRLASGFPSDAIRVSGKTGTWPGVRNEVGVVEYADGGRYAVAVFTATERRTATLPEVDHVIGTAARIAVDALRRTDGGEGNRTPTSALQRPRAPVITTPPGRHSA
jgi:beta-lactamase class A